MESIMWASFRHVETMAHHCSLSCPPHSLACTFIIDTDTSDECIGAVLQQVAACSTRRSSVKVGMISENTNTDMEHMDTSDKDTVISTDIDWFDTWPNTLRFQFWEKDLHPIVYKSRRLIPTEQKFSAQEQEMLAVVYTLQKWRNFVEGSPIVVCTDHESLKHFLTQQQLGWWLARFVDDISHFNVEILYRPGRNQLAADALSRHKNV